MTERGKHGRVRARLVLVDAFKLVDKLDDRDATVSAVASTAFDEIECVRDEASDRALRVGEVSRLVGLSKTEIYRKVREGLDFPSPIELGGKGPKRRVGWRESEVRVWLRQRVKVKR